MHVIGGMKPSQAAVKITIIDADHQGEKVPTIAK